MKFQAPLPYPGHDHRQCIELAIQRAQRLCRQRGARLTELRQRVLELIWQSHRPRGAYDLMEDLGREGRNSAPPTVYRALEFLQEHGLVHRIASLNAFIGCAHPERPHQSAFLICRHCGVALELDLHVFRREMDSVAASHGFALEAVMVEAPGLCPTCREQYPATSQGETS